jgi:large subunit ribosomal protein L15
VPKSGFKNINRIEYKGINLSTLEELAARLKTDRIDFQTLMTSGLINKNSLVKILGNGTLTHKLEVHAHAFSKSAQAAIEANQGTAVKL